MFRTIVIILSFLLVGGSTFADNLQLVDSGPNGFALYRSGAPSIEDVQEWCKLGITEVMVLSGTARKYENKLLPLYCPSIKVSHLFLQQDNRPVTQDFLHSFDNWVEEAKHSNKKILFRCQCGCHRTGRLASYYEMKYLHRTAEATFDNLFRFGSEMDRHLFLLPQILALEDFIKGRECRFKNTEYEESYCVAR